MTVALPEDRRNIARPRLLMGPPLIDGLCYAIPSLWPLDCPFPPFAALSMDS